MRLFCTVLFVLVHAASTSAADKPNIVLIMADDMGFECVGANGSEHYQTPNLDRLAAGGIRFEHAYSQPICTPSRVQIMTGRYNSRNYVKFGWLHPDEITFGNILKQVGYSTCIAGKWQLLGGFEGPNKFGFDEYCLWQLTRRPARYPNPGVEVNGEIVDYNSGEYGPDIVSDYLVDFIKRKKEGPFFAYYPMILPHWPFGPTPDSDHWDPNNKKLWANKNAADFKGMVSYVDKCVGKIDQALADAGVRDNTILIFTCDNGTFHEVKAPFRGMTWVGGKGSTPDAGTHVPFIVSWPNVIKEGRETNDLVDFSDILPTLADIAGAKLPSDRKLDGRSFLPQLKGEKGNPRDFVFCWYSRNGYRDDSVRRFARTQTYKLYHDGRFFDVPADILEKHDLTPDAIDVEAQKTRVALRKVTDELFVDEADFPYRAPVKRRKNEKLRVGAVVVDVTPEQLPVLVNGGMTSRSMSQIKTRINARAIVLDDGKERIGIVVVDSCMMPRTFLDEAKALAAERTEIRPDRMLISASHSHTAPSSMGCLGTDADANYVPYLKTKLAEALAAAEANMEPAKVGWAVGNADEFTALRRWIRRPDKIKTDPFGNPTVRANMHAGANWDDVTGESGPEDPDLSLISFQALDGRPIAVLANFSMHYFGDQGLSADYHGLFCEGLKSRILATPNDGRPPFVGIMSHGCSGDIWRRDYTIPASARGKEPTIERYAEGLVEIALAAYDTIKYDRDADLAMSEARLHLNYRVPDQQRLEWAQQIVDKMGDRLPKDRPEIYAREQLFLHEWQSTDVVVQAVRIGDIGIATTPTETYALTGLKIKLQSPLPKTMVIELANGGDGYIPPPEQLLLGGYNTWPARSAGLEVQAEPKITAAALGLLQEVAGRPQLDYEQSRGAASAAILQAKPVAYWRLDELSGPRAVDVSGRDCDAQYEPAVVYFLEGPCSDSFCTDGETNRAPHFAGGRLQSRIAGLGDKYSISLWLWNGMPVDGRDVSGWIFSRGHNHRLGPSGDHLGIGGTAGNQGKLIFLHGGDTEADKLAAGRTEIKRWTWNHVLFVRDGQSVRVYLNGDSRPEIETQSPAGFPPVFERLFFGGRCDNESNWEGRLDEIAVFDRALGTEEIETLAVPQP